MLDLQDCYWNSTSLPRVTSTSIHSLNHSTTLNQCTYTHTWWVSIFYGIMVFILNKLYFLSPYPNPTLKPTPTENFQHFYIFKFRFLTWCLTKLALYITNIIGSLTNCCVPAVFFLKLLWIIASAKCINVLT